MSDVIIRDFRRADQAAAAELINTGLGWRFGFRDDARNPDLFDIAASYADGCFLVALANDRIVGTGALLQERSRVVRIARMHTAEAFRRRGIASAVLLELESRARGRGAQETILDTNVDWADARAFYRSAGYRELGSSPGEIRFHKRLGALRKAPDPILLDHSPR